MNLIEQQNILKSLTDEALQAEVARPSGTTPPYLIATELERRKSMRESYEGEQARRGKRSTVLEDIMASMRQPGLPAAAPMGGMPAAMPAAPMPMAAPEQGGITAFADGGLVGSGGGLDYAALAERYNTAVNARPEREDRARALALLMAGAGMMSGGSSNTLTNIGKGVAAATGYYSDALQNIDTEERAALRDAMDLNRIQSAEELARLEFDWRRSDAEANRSLREQELAQGRKPASVVESEWYLNATPEEQAAYDKLNPPPVSSAAGANIPKVIDDTFESALKSVPPVDTMTLMRELGRQPTQADVQMAEQQRYRQAELITYQRLRNAYGEAVAAEYAARIGIDPNDALTAPTAPSPAAGGAISYTDYFTE